MKKIVALSLVAFASLSLAACKETPATEANEVTNEVDANATVEETVADINATAEGAVENAGEALENAAETGNAADNAM